MDNKPQYKAVAKAVKRSARNDKRKFFENLASEAEVAAGANNMRELHLLIGRLSNQNINRNHAIKDADGQLLTNTDEQTRRWKQHFESISIITEENHADNLSFIDTSTNITILEDCPNVEEILNAITKLKRNKTPGEDGTPPILL